MVAAENSWNYGGEEYWATSHSKAALGSFYDCAGIRQSPININNSMVQDLYFYNQLSLANYAAEYAGMTNLIQHRFQQIIIIVNYDSSFENLNLSTKQ